MWSIRPAVPADIAAVAAIYEEIHTEEEQGRTTTGWLRGIYPTEATARAAQAAGELYVMEEDGEIVAAARFNQEQDPAYAQADWRFPATPAEVYVMHTLVVRPACSGRGLARAFVAWYCDQARRLGLPALRIDTNARNRRARRLYASLGFREAGIVPCVFNGLDGVQLVCLERRIDE